MSDLDPPRLSEGADPLLKSLVEEGRKELASPEELARVAARLAPVIAGGGSGGATGGGGPSPPIEPPKVAPTPTGVFGGLGVAKWVAMGVIASATLFTVLQIVAAPQPEATMPVIGEGTLAEPPLPSSGPAGHALNPLADLKFPTIPVLEHANHAQTDATAPSVPHNPSGVAEVRMLTAAQDALDRDPAKALGLCNDHARRYPGGVLAQEREVIAIQALLALGRAADAKQRGDAFKKAYPDSALDRRVDELLASPDPAPAPPP